MLEQSTSATISAFIRSDTFKATDVLNISNPEIPPSRLSSHISLASLPWNERSQFDERKT
jgi:hypothetical protein